MILSADTNGQKIGQLDPNIYDTHCQTHDRSVKLTKSPFTDGFSHHKLCEVIITTKLERILNCVPNHDVAQYVYILGIGMNKYDIIHILIFYWLY